MRGNWSVCTPRDTFGAPIRSRWLGGAEMLDDSEGYAPNLTPHEDGMGGRSAAEIIEALHPTVAPGEAGEVVEDPVGSPSQFVFILFCYYR